MKQNLSFNSMSGTVSRSVNTRSNSRLVLIIDNIPSTARNTSLLFEEMGYCTEVVHSTSTALNMLSSGEIFPDLVFVELRSHHESVLQFPRSVHALPLWSRLPVMARTIASDKDNILRAIRNGYCDLILRPTEMDILKEKVEKVFSSSPKIDCATFAIPVSARATVSTDLEIVGISEFGVEAISGIPLKANAVVRLKSDILKQFELGEGHFRVVGCEEVKSGGPAHYKIGLTFVGLNARSTTLIRQFLVRNSNRSLKAS